MTEALAYENQLVMVPLLRALYAECRDGEFVIFRAPFRWLRLEGENIEEQTCGQGHVLNNCYESFSLESVLEMKQLDCRYSFEHAAIVSPRRTTAQPSPNPERRE